VVGRVYKNIERRKERRVVTMSLCETCKRRTFCKDALCQSVEGVPMLECDEYDEIPERKKSRWFG